MSASSSPRRWTMLAVCAFGVAGCTTPPESTLAAADAAAVDVAAAAGAGDAVGSDATVVTASDAAPTAVDAVDGTAADAGDAPAPEDGTADQSGETDAVAQTDDTTADDVLPAALGAACDPCQIADDCATGILCVQYGGSFGAFCATECGAGSTCAVGYACKVVQPAGGGKAVPACILQPPTGEPMGIACPCSPAAIAAKAKTSCTNANANGVCAGVRVCTAAGLAACSAAEAKPEVCDGLDNDCDNQVDENSCEDSSVCTVDSCDPASGCLNDPVAGNPDCDDGSACTSTDICAEGACSGQAIACNDGNPCTIDSCNPKVGCANLPIVASCTDGDACTSGDSCASGTCAGKTIDCNDDDICTTDTCSGSEGCVNLAVATTCNDANLCTTEDSCTANGCLGKPTDCEDDNACTTDKCDAVVGCVHTKLGNGGCNDGNVCTSGDVCTNGQCDGQPIACDDKNACTSESCKAGIGCVYEPSASGGSCDDLSACTQGDSCTLGNCTGTAINCADGNACTDDGCDKIKGCVFLPNAVSCTDANTCTAKDICTGGSCAGQAVACNDNNPCTTDSCKPGSGCVYLAIAATTACNDGNPCTTGDTCKGSVCLPGLSTVSCADTSPCTLDSCDKLKGCMHLPAAGTCTDANPCTLGDTCGNGICLPGTATANCNDANVCTSDSCVAKTGCVQLPVNGTCTDNSLCTAGETCASGVCKPLTVKSCNDSNPCTTDSCAALTGLCKHVLNTLSCDDGIACTTGDVCALGKCAGKNVSNLWAQAIGPSGSYLFGAVAKVGVEFAVLSNAINGVTGVNTASVSRFDATGKVLWQVTFANNLGPHRMFLAGLPDGSLLAAYALNVPVTNMDIGVTKIGPTGTVLWGKNLGGIGLDWPQALVALADGSFVLGEYREGDPLTANNFAVAKYNATGTKLWTTALGAATVYDRVEDVAATPDGGFVAAGYTTSKGAGLTDGWLVRLDSAGKLVWDATFGGKEHDRLTHVAQLPDGGFGLYGLTRSKLSPASPLYWLLRTDSTGKLVWEKTLGAPPPNTFNGNEFDVSTASLAATSEGGFVLLATEVTGTGDSNFRVIRTTASGDVIWSRLYGESAFDEPWQLVVLAGDHLLIGGGHMFPANNDIRPWLLKTDAWGHFDCTKSGLCAAMSPAKCGDDGNVCTDDGCDAVKGCVKANNTVPCNSDGVACTPDMCAAGKCVSSPASNVLCDDKKPWTKDVCALPLGCTNTCIDTPVAQPAQRVTITAGDFWMGCNATTDTECGSQEKPQHKVTLSQYDIDIYEVTVAQYKLCVQAGKCSAPSTYNTMCNWNTPCKEQHPVNCVMWPQADAYCKWIGGRLPTDAEWEKAARGGCEKYPNKNCATAMPKYPWGDSGWGCTNAVTQNGCGTGSTASVGSKPTGKSVYGVHDLIGNVLEWTQDYYSGSYYPISPAVDPQGPATGAARVVRGGAFGGYMFNPAEQRNGTRYDYSAGHYGYGAGFRCVVPKKP